MLLIPLNKYLNMVYCSQTWKKYLKSLNKHGIFFYGHKYFIYGFKLIKFFCLFLKKMFFYKKKKKKILFILFQFSKKSHILTISLCLEAVLDQASASFSSCIADTRNTILHLVVSDDINDLQNVSSSRHSKKNISIYKKPPKH